MYDFTYIKHYLNLIREYAYKKNICVFMPTIELKKSKYYSAVYVFNCDSGDRVIYKKGLTPSEKILITGKASKKSFKLNGIELGVLICREMQDKPFKYFNKKSLPDLILWPSYWGWTYKMKWGPIRLTDGKRDKCYHLISKLKRPLVQINMSNTFGSDDSKVLGGKSVIVDSENRKIGLGKYGQEDRFLVSFNGLKLRLVAN
jgi:predicted amidohydrolase